MDVRAVIDELGRQVDIDYDTKRLYDYDNDLRRVIWKAKIAKEDESESESYVTFVEDGTVDSIEQRMSKWNNFLAVMYAEAVRFDPIVNDPNKKIFKIFVEMVKLEEDKYFTKSGNLRKKYCMGAEQLSKFKKSIADLNEMLGFSKTLKPEEPLKQEGRMSEQMFSFLDCPWQTI